MEKDRHLVHFNHDVGEKKFVAVLRCDHPVIVPLIVLLLPLRFATSLVEVYAST